MDKKENEKLFGLQSPKIFVVDDIVTNEKDIELKRIQKNIYRDYLKDMGKRYVDDKKFFVDGFRIKKEQLEPKYIKELKEVSKYVGENSFIDKQMATLYSNLAKQQDMQLVNGVFKCAIQYEYEFDEERIKKWLEFCNKMNNIDQTDLISLAVSNKFAELNKRIKDLEYENGELKERIGLLEEDWED